MAEYSAPPPSDTPPDANTPDPFKIWRARIKKMRKLRKDWEKDFKVEKCEKFYLGDQWEGDKGPRVMNHYLATIRVTQPNLLFDNPKVLVRPRPGHEQEARRKAAMGESTLQAIMEQDDNFAEACGFGLLQAFWRVGVLKVIYDPTLEPNPNYQGPQTPMMSYDEKGNAINNIDGTPRMMTHPNTGQPIMEPELIVSDETYRWEWIAAENMLFPDVGPYMKKWPYIGEEVTCTIEEAKADERFPPDLRDQFASNVKKDEHGRVKARTEANDHGDDDNDALFQYTEIYDIKKKRFLCIAEDQPFQEVLYDDVLPDGIEDHPYSILPGYLPNTGPKPSPWPMPYTYSWLDPQEEYNIRRQQGMEGGKRSARKIGYDEGTFDGDGTESLKALQSSRDMEAVKIRDTNRPWVVIQDPPLPDAINRDIPLLLNDYRIIAGQPGAKLGTPDADTATEAALVQRSSDLRDSEMQKAVQKWLKTSLKKMYQLVRKTLTTKMFVKIRGMADQEVAQFLMAKYQIPIEAVQMVPGLMDYVVQAYGQDKVEPISREDLDFEADVDVLPGSTKPRSLTSERAQFLEVMQILATSPQLMMSRLLMEELFKKYEFINPALIDELQLMAQQMMAVKANQAGRQPAAQGGEGSVPENTKGKGPGNLAQAKAKIAQSPQAA